MTSSWPGRSWLHTVFLALIGLTASACPPSPDAAEPQPEARTRVVAGPVALPTAAGWQSAQVESSLERASRTRSGRNIGREITWPLTHTLVLGEGAEATRIRLATRTLPDTTSDEERAAGASAPWTLLAAADGSALAVGAADDGEPGVVTLGPWPLFCPELRVPRVGDEGAGFDAAPGARDLALAHLSPTHLSALHPGTAESATAWQALTWAVGHPDDDELHDAVVSSLLSGNPRLDIRDGTDAVRSDQGLVARRPALASALRPGLDPATAWSRGADNAVVALERVADPTLQGPLAALAATRIPARSAPGTQLEGNFHRHALRALSRSVARSGRATADAESVLVGMATSDDG